MTQEEQTERDKNRDTILAYTDILDECDFEECFGTKERTDMTLSESDAVLNFLSITGMSTMRRVLSAALTRMLAKAVSRGTAAIQTLPDAEEIDLIKQQLEKLRKENQSN